MFHETIFLVNETILTSNKSFRLKKNNNKNGIKIIMAIDERIASEKISYDFNRTIAKIFPLSFGQLDKFEYLRGFDILPLEQNRIIKQR